MKQIVLITLLVVTLASFAYAEDETKLEESGKYNDRIVNGISNVFFEHDQQVDSQTDLTSHNLREKRSGPLKYNRDGTISLICRFSPELCRNNRLTTRSARTRRGGKRLLSLYLKPSAPWGSSLDNLRKSAGLNVPKSATSKQSKGTRLISLSLKSPRQKPQPRVPSNIYTRAFTRFTDDFTRTDRDTRIGRIIGNQRRVKPNQRPRPRPGSVRTRSGRRSQRGRRTPPRPRLNYRRRSGKGKEVFSLYLKPSALKPKLIPGGRFAPPRSETVPLICKFQPKKCGQRGKKIFSLHMKSFKSLFPYAFPLV